MNRIRPRARRAGEPRSDLTDHVVVHRAMTDDRDRFATAAAPPADHRRLQAEFRPMYAARERLRFGTP